MHGEVFRNVTLSSSLTPQANSTKNSIRMLSLISESKPSPPPPPPPPPQYLEVKCGSTGKIQRFAAGTDAGFALALINRKLKGTVPVATHIEAVKDGEESISFGQTAILSHFGDGWQLQTVLPSEEVRNGHLRRRTPESFSGVPGDERRESKPVSLLNLETEMPRTRGHGWRPPPGVWPYIPPSPQREMTSQSARKRRRSLLRASTSQAHHQEDTDEEQSEEDIPEQQLPAVASTSSSEGSMFDYDADEQEVVHEEEAGDEDEEEVADDEEPPEDQPYPGGPIDRSLIGEGYRRHRAWWVWQGHEPPVLKVASHGRKLLKFTAKSDPLPQQIREVLQICGLFHLQWAGHDLVDYALISAFTERWHSQTKSFHLPFGEMTVTLQDVACILGVSISGKFYTYPQPDRDIYVTEMMELFGVSKMDCLREFNKRRGARISLDWLRKTFQQRQMERRLVEATRAYVLHLLGCTILADKSFTFIDCKYLPLVRDVDALGSWAWGAMALAYLYQYLDHAAVGDTKQIGGHATLLQAWIYEYFPTLGFRVANRSYVPGIHARANRFQQKKPTWTTMQYRVTLDSLTAGDICWEPFRYDIAQRRVHDPRFDDFAGFSGFLRHGAWTVAHLPERCLRQYGFRQGIPRHPPVCPAAPQVLSDWSNPMEHTFRRTMMLELQQSGHPGECSDGYIDWFESVSHPRMLPPGIKYVIPPPRFGPVALHPYHGPSPVHLPPQHGPVHPPSPLHAPHSPPPCVTCDSVGGILQSMTQSFTQLGLDGTQVDDQLRSALALIYGDGGGMGGGRI